MSTVAVTLLVLVTSGAWAQPRDLAVERVASEKRVALVIGNGAYPSPADLKNPVNDAQDMAEALRARASAPRSSPRRRRRSSSAGDLQKPWEREVLVAANQRAEVVIDIEPLRPEPPAPPRSEDAAEMVRVPPGEFWMGSDDGDANEKPRHRVHLDAYAIDTYEVTNTLYKRFMDATGRLAPFFWSDPKGNGGTQPNGRRPRAAPVPQHRVPAREGVFRSC